MRFSDRIGVTTPQQVLLLDQISVALRNSLWNFLLSWLFRGRDEDYRSSGVTIAKRFFKYPVDSLPKYGFQRKGWLRAYFFNDDTRWYQIYNLLEFIIVNGPILRSYMKPEKTIPAVNKVLEEEMSGYRFVNGQLAPITNEGEVSAISTAIEQADSLGFSGVRTHLDESLSLMSKKPTPDYRNSIKESISGVSRPLSNKSQARHLAALKRSLRSLTRKFSFTGPSKQGC